MRNAEEWRTETLFLGRTPPPARSSGPVEFKGARTATLPGSVTAILGHVGVVDRDGDILDSGSMRPAPHVVVSPWNHSAIRPGEGEPPVGRAVRVWEESGAIMAKITFDDTPEGQKACKRISTERPDWSFGLRSVVTRPLTEDERRRGARRALKSFELFEVSPVDKGASVAQGTAHACCGSCALGAAGKAHPVCDTPPAPDEVVPSQRALAKRVQASAQRVKVNRLLSSIRGSIDRIEGRADL